MLSALKSPVKAILARAGLSLKRLKPPEPFHELWDVPRFTRYEVELLGRPFQVADALSFYFSYQEIFVDQIYQFNAKSAVPRIIDCGSNYGTSIVYFKSLYPSARVTGVEADPEIFTLLAANTSHLNVELLNMAVSDNHDPVSFFKEGSDGGRASHELVGAKGTVEVKALTLDDLIDGPVDFLKIDIEGSEGKALDACTKLGQVDQLFIEYHSFKESPQTLGRMLDKLSANGFRYYIHKQFCSAHPLTVEALQLGMDLQLNIFAKRITAEAGA